MYISYFYQIRNFPSPRYLPISTAKYDPLWYRPVHIDKRGILNGMRLPLLNPQTEECANCLSRDPSNCAFIKNYREYLASLDINIIQEKIHEICKKASNYYQESISFIPVLIVYEAPSNKCSERGPLIDYFNLNNIPLLEFSK